MINDVHRVAAIVDELGGYDWPPSYGLIPEADRERLDARARTLGMGPREFFEQERAAAKDTTEADAAALVAEIRRPRP